MAAASAKAFYLYQRVELGQELFGLTFKNPVGLAAGFDKRGKAIEAMFALGAGFTEVGTVVPLAQPGNPLPRMKRIEERKALWNWMGFNSPGAEVVLENLKAALPFRQPVGVNVGKNKETSNENAINDYLSGLAKFNGIADYLVVNVSSPNTDRLRELQDVEFLAALLTKAREIGVAKPILIKISPDVALDTAHAICDVAVEHGAAGIIVTNTTINYAFVGINIDNKGGISGEPLKELSFRMLSNLAREYRDKLVFISVGGIDSAEEAYRRIKAGASLVQLYTNLVYEGPSEIKAIKRGLVKLLRRDGYKNIEDAIGAGIAAS